MSAPVRVTVGERNTISASVSQRLLFVGQLGLFKRPHSNTFKMFHTPKL
jgi:hypothetical protein